MNGYEKPMSPKGNCVVMQSGGPTGERVFDIGRGPDYPATYRDVDWKTAGVMGNSRGGAISMLSAALLPH